MYNTRVNVDQTNLFNLITQFFELFMKLFCGHPPNLLEGRQEVIAGPHREPIYVVEILAPKQP